MATMTADEWIKWNQARTQAGAEMGNRRLNNFNAILPGVYSETMADPTKTYAVNTPDLKVEMPAGAFGGGAAGAAGGAKDPYTQAYETLMAGYDARKAGLQGYGDQARQDVRDTWANASASQYNNMISNGLSSVSGGMNFADRESADLRKVDEAMQLVMSGVDLDKLQAMERYNSPQMYLSLMEKLGEQQGSASANLAPRMVNMGVGNGKTGGAGLTAQGLLALLGLA